ncbi:MBL fold metallo-hydrolase [Aquabacterium sp. J223]|uniref:MBL fold metallo-hydrolase n=1 Tax=Aquabacterium sp. J223 TaxID=2898431 RepID=UPI0021ADD557|nr:3',5'-cyclic-nucleotide phosphodiesterase [Aquabacterium sp. J223]UUX96283.1 3',5'-cyclic-nucleotide phosphodiesterase [Aquabacterium sp. J223]
MTIRVLGCSGAIAADCRTTAFLLDDDVLIDAGSGVGDLTLDELVRIDHILVSHSHLDHVLAIGLLADSVLRRRQDTGRGAITVHGLASTLQALREHLFNGVIWPDFTRLPSAEQPALRLTPFTVGDRLAVGRRHVEVLPARHTVPAVGFAVLADGDGPAPWAYSGDTADEPALWQRLTDLGIRELVIETAFGNDEQPLAEISQHLCPRTLGRALAQLPEGLQVHITHVKPGELEAVMRQVRRLDAPQTIRALNAGHRFELNEA